MNATKIKTRQEYVEILISIVHNLPIERVPQVVDFARFIEAQVEEVLEDEETAEEIAASEAKWGELFARPEAQAKLLEMARDAREAAKAGLAYDMEFDEEGNLCPPPNA